MNQMQSVGFRSIPSQMILNPKGGGIGIVRLRSSRSIPLPFPNRTVSARRSKIDEDLLKLFKKVEINIPLLDAIKQIPKYAKFLKELCAHKRKKKGTIEMGGVVSALVKHEDAGAVPCTIGYRTFTDAMLDLEALTNVMPASIYKSLNLGDLEPTGKKI
ncbi:hypothetical protein CR513_09531, partial [Mucuna pruriens]